MGVAIKLTCMTHLHFVRAGQKNFLIPLQLAMSYEYLSSLDYSAQKRYLEKLKIDKETLPDPYAIAENLWKDDVSFWPNFEFGGFFTLLLVQQHRTIYEGETKSVQIVGSL